MSSRRSNPYICFALEKDALDFLSLKGYSPEFYRIDHLTRAMADELDLPESGYYVYAWKKKRYLMWDGKKEIDALMNRRNRT